MTGSEKEPPLWSVLLIADAGFVLTSLALSTSPWSLADQAVFFAATFIPVAPIAYCTPLAIVIAIDWVSNKLIGIHPAEIATEVAISVFERLPWWANVFLFGIYAAALMHLIASAGLHGGSEFCMGRYGGTGC